MATRLTRSLTFLAALKWAVIYLLDRGTGLSFDDLLTFALRSEFQASSSYLRMLRRSGSLFNAWPFTPLRSVSSLLP